MARSIRYLPADGAAAVSLTAPKRSTGARAQRGVKGWGLPPVVADSEDIAGADGEWLLGAKYGAREILLPVMIEAPTRAEYRAELRALEAALGGIHSGAGELEVSEDGEARRIRALYVGGLEGSEEWGEHGLRWWRTALRFVAHDPYWYDSALTVAAEWRQADPVGFLAPPMLPLKLSASSSFGNVEVTNAGDGSTWPVWTITGPASSVTLRNRTTGEAITIGDGVAAGRSMQIVTEPGIADVTITNPAESGWSALSPSSELWPLAPGRNLIEVAIASTTSASVVRLEYRRRYRSIQ